LLLCFDRFLVIEIASAGSIAKIVAALLSPDVFPDEIERFSVQMTGASPQAAKIVQL
jgi:hypothetical protein